MICLFCSGEGKASDQHAQIEARIDAIWKQVEAMEAARAQDWLTREQAEDVRNMALDVIADADTRTSLQGHKTTFGYDDGFYMRTEDNSFMLKLRGQLQFRWMIDHRDKMSGQRFGKSDIYGFELRRMKLHFTGHVVDPSLTFHLTLATNTRALAYSPESNVFIENAFIQKQFENGMYFKMGQYKGPYTREEIVPSAIQLAVERSMVNHAFTYGWVQGAEIGWNLDNVHLRAMYNDGPRQLNVGAYRARMRSLLARMDLVLAGEYSEFHTLTSRGVDGFGFMLGAAIEWYMLKDPERLWVYGNAAAEESLGFTVDLSMFDEGWTIFTYFVWANGRNTTLGVDQPTVDSWGWVGQGGITLFEDVQLFGRYELGNINDYRGSLSLPGETGHLSTLTVGLNWWPIGIQDVKITCDFGYSFSNVAGGPGANENPLNPSTNPGYALWPGRGNGWQPDYGNQDGQWLLRAQFQLEF